MTISSSTDTILLAIVSVGQSGHLAWVSVTNQMIPSKIYKNKDGSLYSLIISE